MRHFPLLFLLFCVAKCVRWVYQELNGNCHFCHHVQVALLCYSKVRVGCDASPCSPHQLPCSSSTAVLLLSLFSQRPWPRAWQAAQPPVGPPTAPCLWLDSQCPVTFWCQARVECFASLREALLQLPTIPLPTRNPPFNILHALVSKPVSSSQKVMSIVSH
jgi:hypothetical protein